MMATVGQKLRLLFGAKTGKGRVRGHMMWLPHHSRTCGERRVRGHMMCLPHLSRIFTVFSTRMSWGLGLLGQTRKPLGRVQLLHLSGPRGAQHDACADHRDARKKKSAHDISHLTTVH